MVEPMQAGVGPAAPMTREAPVIEATLAIGDRRTGDFLFISVRMAQLFLSRLVY
jgi:hypothetical protein